MAYGFNPDRSKAPVYTKSEVDQSFDQVEETLESYVKLTDIMDVDKPGIAKVGSGLEVSNGVLALNSGDMSSAVSDWLDDHPEATTTVLDGSITEAKFADSLKDFLLVEDSRTYKTNYYVDYWYATAPQLSSVWVPLTLHADIDVSSIAFTTTYSGNGTVSVYFADTSGTRISDISTADVSSGQNEAIVSFDEHLSAGEYRIYFSVSNITMNYPNKIYPQTPAYDDGIISGIGTAYYANNSNLVFVGSISYTVMVPSDKTLSIKDKAADAKATGDAISSLNHFVENLNQNDMTVIEDKKIYDINHLSNLKYNQTLVNGVYTFVAPSQNNNWAEYIIDDDDLDGGIGKVVVNVVSCQGTWRMYRIFNTTGGTTKYMYYVGQDITTTGKHEYEVDLNYLSVYEDYDGNGVSIALANQGTFDPDTIVIDQYDLVMPLSVFDNLPRSLNSVLNEVKNSIDDIEHGDIGKNIVLRSPSGSAYSLQVKNDGTLITVPIIPNNVLYIGNSLLIGFVNHGMASTTVNDDYYAKLNSYIAEKASAPTATKLSGTTFEACETDAAVNTWINGTLSSYMSNDVDLVLIQLGDNVNTSGKLAEFEKSADMLCSYIREHCPNARVAWVGEWYYSTAKQDIIKSACEKYGCIFIDICDISDGDGNRSHVGAKYIDYNGIEQTIELPGVASHPSDQGFTQITNRIIRELFE